jgi:hypothetical protein
MSQFAGPFALTPEDLTTRIPAKTKGAFVLITVHEGDPYVRYVGRSDDDLEKELQKWVGRYDQYAFSVADDDVVAFLQECDAFHDYGGLVDLANVLHPSPPLKDLFCTTCGFGDANVKVPGR